MTQNKAPSAAWPRWIRLQKEKDGGALEAAIAEQLELERKYPLRNGRVVKREDMNGN
jgi:hypothetical protein